MDDIKSALLGDKEAAKRLTEKGVLLMQGDCLELLKDIPDDSVDMVLTDPPYSSGGMYRSDRASGSSKKYQSTDTKDIKPDFAGDNRDQRSFTLWETFWVSAAKRKMRPGGIAVIPVSREQVKRIWFREPYTRLGTKYGENGDIVYSSVNTCMACGHETPIGNFCHNCGAAQTREAVQMVMERLEALRDNHI